MNGCVLIEHKCNAKLDCKTHPLSRDVAEDLKEFDFAFNDNGRVKINSGGMPPQMQPGQVIRFFKGNALQFPNGHMRPLVLRFYSLTVHRTKVCGQLCYW